MYGNWKSSNGVIYEFYSIFLSKCFEKEKDVFLKLIYLFIIASNPQIFFIGNQGTYTMDLSIKVNFKVSSKWADNSPVISWIIFTIHKLKYHIISSTSIFNPFKKTKKI